MPKFVVTIKPGTSQEKIIEKTPGELTIYLRAKVIARFAAGTDAFSRRSYDSHSLPCPQSPVDKIVLHVHYNQKFVRFHGIPSDSFYRSCRRRAERHLCQFCDHFHAYISGIKDYCILLYMNHQSK